MRIAPAPLAARHPLATLATLALLAVAGPLGAQAQSGDSAPGPRDNRGIRDRRPQRSAAEEFLTRAIRPEEAARHLRALTKAPHIAGSPGDRETAEYVRGVLDRAGFTTEIEEFHVLLTTPEDIKLSLTQPVRHAFDLREQPYPWDAETLKKNPSFHTFNGYSPSGTVHTEVVYAHYGRPADFEWLASQSIDVRGKICLIRYGQTFRGLKVREAQEHGAAGVLLYSDPDDDGYRKGEVYPKGPYRSRTGVQRGSIMFISDLVGDPLTPGIPATKDAPRLRREDCDWLPKIPCMPISWGNALRIFEHLGGPKVRSDWQGGCPTTYHLGPGPAKVRMELRMKETVQPIWNVVGRLRAKSTSDRFVLIGNHRDAWVYGANDPNTGSAASLAAMTALGGLVKDGWEPRVEIRYASWDAEEQGLIGSTEHAEAHREEYQAKCLAYFNCDAAVSGPRFAASSTPELVGVLAYAAARTDAHDGKGRILTRWARGGSRPPVGNLGSGSDYTAFLCHLGIPAFDLGSRGGHGVYHSIFDNFDTVSRFMDEGFAIHASVARCLAIATHHFASRPTPPLELTAIAPYLKSCMGSLDGLQVEQRNALAEAITALGRAAKAAPATEAQMLAMHPVFLDAQGLAGRPWYRNLVVAPGRNLGYGAQVMPGIAEALADGDPDRIAREVQRMLACIQRATAVFER